MAISLFFSFEAMHQNYFDCKQEKLNLSKKNLPEEYGVALMKAGKHRWLWRFRVPERKSTWPPLNLCSALAHFWQGWQGGGKTPRV